MEQLTEFEYKKDATVKASGGFRSVWYNLCEKLQDWSDIFYIWLHRNDPKIPLCEFMEEVDKMNKSDAQSNCQ